MPGKPFPPQVTTDLLDYLSTHTMDEDYQARARNGRTTKSRAERGRGAWTAALVVALFALLVITAAVQTSRNAVSAAAERQGLVGQLKTRQAGLIAEQRLASQLRIETATLEARAVDNSRSATGLLAQVRTLSLLTGNQAVAGPGVRVVVDDAPSATSARQQVLDTDLQHLANGLWEAGAEAISINGQRLTNLSSIRHAGSAITVNYRSLSRPYTVLAIGNPNTLPARFADTSSGQAWLDLQNQVGLQFTMRTEESLTLPSANVAPLQYAVRAPASKGGR